ncbi:MAG: alpha/beta fold hydrolase [Syntrophobacteria bacterium]
MPIITQSSYVPPIGFRNGHIQSLFPTLFRRVKGVTYERERIWTPDDDFLDLDWSRVGARRLAIITHGLEGSSERWYILGMVRAVNRNGWDGLAWNMRGCSGEQNKKLRSYHSGASEDLHAVIQHVIADQEYSSIALVGFSLGGNMTFKYLGERGQRVNPAIARAVACSVPCDLASGAEKMARFSNKFYMKRFMRMLHEKIKAKMRIMPGRISDEGYHQIKTFKEFDDRYTAPINGFRDVDDYYRQASCKQFLHNLTIPSLLVNAKNDPFLAEPCYPIEEAKANPNFFLEMPESGGHVGFISFNKKREYWFESRVVSFLNEAMGGAKSFNLYE